MNQKAFEELVKDFRLLNKDTITELEQLLKEYPFCQTFHLLYTKNLYNQKHIRFHQQLKLASAIVGDRSRLKHYLNDSDVKADISSEQDIDSLKDIQQSVFSQTNSLDPFNVAVESEIFSFPIHYTDLSREEKKRAIIEQINKKFANQLNVADPINSERLSPESENGNNHQSTAVDNINLVDDLAEEQISSEVSSNDVPFISSEVDPSHSEESELKDVKYEQREPIINDIVIEDSENSKELLQPEERQEPKTSRELIERFLRDTPRISRPKKEFYNPVNLAARSLEENEDFYTETYASICLKQGDISKGIKIYEKLSLKFPEKSSYFAGLINKIKKEHNI